MQKVKIVIDLGFGDCGKGVVTDSLCIDEPNSIVVRFSGGQQCGHTVYLDKDTSHVHSSFGSGTLRGVPSYFSEHCTMYLPNLINEFNELVSKGAKPKLFLHPLTRVTTPYDVMFNRLNSENLQNGTVGLGIGATMKRHDSTVCKIHAIDFLNKDLFKIKLEAIKNYYTKTYGSFEGLVYTHVKSRYGVMSTSEVGNRLLEDYNNEIKIFTQLIETINYKDYFNIKSYDTILNYDNIVFEGSQGILLDMDHGTIPNVTYANTTSKNALEIINKLSNLYNNNNNVIYNIEMYYVTRAYLTRHGNGWMPEGKQIELENNSMEINVYDAYQGNFKFQELDYGLLNYSLEVDKIYTETHKTTSINTSKFIKHLVVTCNDQTDEVFNINKLDFNIDCIILRNNHISSKIY